MKKPNRIARNGDITRAAAQSKPAAKRHRAARHEAAPAGAPSQTARSAQWRGAVQPMLREPADLADDGGSEQYGEEIAYMDLANGNEQFLYKRGGAYTLVTEGRMYHDGEHWRSVGEYLESHPKTSLFQMETALRTFPLARLKSFRAAEPIERPEILEWLFNELVCAFVPAEFQEHFRPKALTSPARLGKEGEAQ